MDKSQALHAFWSSFGLKAYDENSVPDNAVMPYITYQTATDSVGNKLLLNASIWDISTSWAWISQKADQIAEYIGKYGHLSVKIDTGYMYISKASPFAQRMSDESNKNIKRIIIQIQAEFLTAY